MMPETLKKAEGCYNCGIARYDGRGYSQEDAKCFTKNHKHSWHIPSDVVASAFEAARKEINDFFPCFCEHVSSYLREKGVKCNNCETKKKVFAVLGEERKMSELTKEVRKEQAWKAYKEVRAQAWKAYKEACRKIDEEDAVLGEEKKKSGGERK